MGTTADIPSHLQPFVAAMTALPADQRRLVIEASTGAQASAPTQKRAPYMYSEEAMAYLGLTERLKNPRHALDRLLRTGRLPRRKIGGQLVFAVADLDKLLATGDAGKRRGRPKGATGRRKAS